MRKKVLFLGLLIVAGISVNLEKVADNIPSNSTIGCLFKFKLVNAENGFSDTKCNGQACENQNGVIYGTFASDSGIRYCCGIATESNRGCKDS